MNFSSILHLLLNPTSASPRNFLLQTFYSSQLQKLSSSPTEHARANFLKLSTRFLRFRSQQIASTTDFVCTSTLIQSRFRIECKLTAKWKVKLTKQHRKLHSRSGDPVEHLAGCWAPDSMERQQLLDDNEKAISSAKRTKLVRNLPRTVPAAEAAAPPWTSDMETRDCLVGPTAAIRMFP
jgi:hypothetical protein